MLRYTSPSAACALMHMVLSAPPPSQAFAHARARSPKPTASLKSATASGGRVSGSVFALARVAPSVSACEGVAPHATSAADCLSWETPDRAMAYCGVSRSDAALSESPSARASASWYLASAPSYSRSSRCTDARWHSASICRASGVTRPYRKISAPPSSLSHSGGSVAILCSLSAAAAACGACARRPEERSSSQVEQSPSSAAHTCMEPSPMCCSPLSMSTS
mmetsp:Transcript_12430/g.52299  ORF Transcript_12430/g.52299 Transcript_12430/m.52299 type:complete len:222 (+) Transcript_12430:288-953(+)